MERAAVDSICELLVGNDGLAACCGGAHVHNAKQAGTVGFAACDGEFRNGNGCRFAITQPLRQLANGCTGKRLVVRGALCAAIGLWFYTDTCCRDGSCRADLELKGWCFALRLGCTSDSDDAFPHPGELFDSLVALICAEDTGRNGGCMTDFVRSDGVRVHC
jgi:hypothetical protein